MTEDATRNTDAKDLRRQKIELEELRREWSPFLSKRITRRWLRGTETDALNVLSKLWLLEWNVENNPTAGERYDRTQAELRHRKQKGGQLC
jgi:hypothetical protein